MKLIEFFKQKWQKHLECKAQNKQYKIALQELHKEFKPNTKWDSKNSNWKKEWLPFIKYNNSWDWEYLYEVIIYKIKLLKIHMSIYSHAAEEWTERINKEIDEVLNFGKYVYEHDYGKVFHDFALEHTTPIVHIYKRAPKEGLFQVNTYDQSNLIKSISTKRDTWDFGTTEIPSPFGERKEADKWCEENGYNPHKDVRYAYSSEWDSDENYEIYKQLMQEAADEEQADWDRFFLLISKYFKGWWD